MPASEARCAATNTCVLDRCNHEKLASYRSKGAAAQMVVTVLYSLLAGFFVWIVLDFVTEALFPRLMDPSVTQRSKPPLAAVIVNCTLVGVGVAVAAVVFVMRLGLTGA